jgi:hypothetical protein
MKRIPVMLFVPLLLTAAGLPAADRSTAPVVADGLRLCDVYSVRDYGARGDGVADDTAAFQRALDAAGRAGGGIVWACRGSYFFAGHLDVPPGVALRGVWESVPSHPGLRDPGKAHPLQQGTTLLVTENAGKELGPPFITLHDNSTLRGVTLYYPRQATDAAPTPYPWAVALRGDNPALLDVELLNPYQGIDASKNQRHLIRNVSGQPLRRGVWVDAIYDNGRIENVHFNPWWSYKTPVYHWQTENGEAFLFGRSDWQSMTNTFCFGYKTGYRFVQTASGSANGSFVGIGADACNRAILLEQCNPGGLAITNGVFNAYHGPQPTMIEVTAGNTGTLRLLNCSFFWGQTYQIAHIGGNGTVSFSDCTFNSFSKKEETAPSIVALGGTLLVRGCEFRENRPQVELGSQVRKAIIMGNVFAGRSRIVNKSKGNVQIADNAADE